MREHRPFRRWLMPLLVAVCALQGACSWAMEYQIAGKTAEDVFKGPHLADLANAACDGDSRGIAAAITAGADPNGLSIDGGTPLLWAVYCNNPQGVEALLRAGANPNYEVRGKYSATFAAATATNPQVLRLLLSHGGNPNTDDGGQWTALRWALETGIHKNLWDNYYTLLNGGADINRIGPSGLTIAVEAAMAGRFDKVVELLDRGYSRDLTYLGATTQNRRLSPSDPQLAWREKAEALLQQKGVEFPIGPLHRRMQ